MDETLAQLAKFFHKLLTDKPRFHGKVQINFWDGKVPNANVQIEESIKFDSRTADVVQNR